MNYANPFEQPLSGLEIKDWVWYHSHHKTKYTALAKRMSFCFNLDNEKFYMLVLENDMPIAKEVPERTLL